jgi:hypothetical protein
LCDVEGKEGEEKCPSNPINEADRDDDPEQVWELTIDFIQATEHKHPFVWEPQL